MNEQFEQNITKAFEDFFEVFVVALKTRAPNAGAPPKPLKKWCRLFFLAGASFIESESEYNITIDQLMALAKRFMEAS